MRLSEIHQVIVQAGGRGSRLGRHTANKPKCLLSIDGQPLLYRLFDQLPQARLTVIGDSQVSALEAYLDLVPPPVPLTVIRASGTGSLAGMRTALAGLADPAGAVLILWCDLFFEAGLAEVTVGEDPLVGVTDRFRCRWSVDEGGRLVELAADQRGVAGVFYFPAATMLADLPASGEFVRYLSESGLDPRPIPIPGIREFGTLAAVEAYTAGRQVTRFFNQIEVTERVVVKRARDRRYQHLIDAEVNWYQRARELGFQNTPRMLAPDPFTLERLAGRHPFELPLGSQERDALTQQIMDTLADLHGRSGGRPAVPSACAEMYWDKTLERLARVERIIPNRAEPVLTIEGQRCRNPLHARHQTWFRDTIAAIGTVPFAFIHGDPTFSNLLVDDSGRVWLIDPRGTFGDLACHGDPRYDWAKLRYSLAGDYDQFNRRRFELRVDGTDVRLSLASNGWAGQERLLRRRLTDLGWDRAVDVIHALIWLSLSGYVLDDLDSMLGAFYQGVRYLELAER